MIRKDGREGCRVFNTYGTSIEPEWREDRRLTSRFHLHFVVRIYNFAFISQRVNIARRDNSDISSVSNNSGLKAITAMMVTNRWVAENWSLTSLFRTDDSTRAWQCRWFTFTFYCYEPKRLLLPSTRSFTTVRCKINSLRFPFVSRKQVDIAKPVITKKN